MSTLSNHTTVMAHTILANDIRADNVFTQTLQASFIETENITFNGTIFDLGDIANYDPTSITPFTGNTGWVYGYTVSNKMFELDNAQSGATIGNGKIAVVSSFDHMDVQKTMITTEMKYTQGMFRPNVLEPFYVNHVKFFHHQIDKSIVMVKSQELDMYGAIVTSGYNVTEKNTDNSLHLDTSMYCPRNHPFSIMQTFNVTPLNTASMSNVPFFHEVYCKDNLRDVEYNNNVIYNETLSSDHGLYVLTGKGYATDTGRMVTFASCYLFEQQSNVENLGFNVYRNDMRRCYHKFKFKEVNAMVPTRFHIFTTMMTEYDFDAPMEEVKRIVVSVAYRCATPALSASRVRSDHVLMWQSLWKTQIAISPKTGITQALDVDIERKNILIKTAMYNIYSSVRENINMEINPLNLSVVDQLGMVLYDGDFWLVPLLNLIKPDIARSMLEFRYKTLNIAQQIAAGYGFTGAKFPYVDDMLGYKNAMYYNTLSPMHVFNNGLIAINIWNYYRVTRDRDWLIAKGYSMLKHIADFFVSILEVGANGAYYLRHVVGLNDVESMENNSFTNNIVRLALRYAIEASYELGYPVRQEWNSAYFDLPVLYVDTLVNHDVIKFDQAALGTQQYGVLETLYVLMPLFSQLYFCSDSLHSPQSIKRNIDYYTMRMAGDEANHPYNIAILAILHGLYAQYDEAHVAQYAEYLNDFIREHVNGIWNNMQQYKSGSPSNSLIMNSMFLMILLQGMPQVNVVGGVSETRFYYEEMRIKALVTANMPNHWNNIKVAQIGKDKKTFITRNSLYYMTY